MMTSSSLTSPLMSLLLLVCASSLSLATSEQQDAELGDVAAAYDADVYGSSDGDSLYKRAPTYGFGLGKRYPAYGFGLGKRGGPYSFGLGKRVPSYGFGLGKRSRSYGFGLGKRTSSYGFGLGKRQSYGFGLGKRSWSSWFDGPARDVLKRPSYGFGLGKRSVPSFLDGQDDDSRRQAFLSAAARLADEARPDSDSQPALSPSHGAEGADGSLRQDTANKESPVGRASYTSPL